MLLRHASCFVYIASTEIYPLSWQVGRLGLRYLAAFVPPAFLQHTWQLSIVQDSELLMQATLL